MQTLLLLSLTDVRGHQIIIMDADLRQCFRSIYRLRCLVTTRPAMSTVILVYSITFSDLVVSAVSFYLLSRFTVC